MSPVYRDDDEGREERLDLLREQAGEHVRAEEKAQTADRRRRHVSDERPKELTMPSEMRRRPETEDQPIRPNEETIRDRAYRKFEERGREPGHDLDDWLEAEHELQEPQKSHR